MILGEDETWLSMLYYPSVHGQKQTSMPSGLAYNATIEEVRIVHEGLRILGVRLDGSPPAFVPGQYVSLGLGPWESPIDGTFAQAEPHDRKMIRRAYSLSARILDDSGALISPYQDSCWWFLVALVIGTVEHPAELTPRLFALRPASRLYVSTHPKGNYTAENVAPDDDVLFIATGTGEAPHNAMIADLLLKRHRGRIASLVGARYRRDLAYLPTHRELEKRFAHYRYITLTTREPENIDRSCPGYVGKQYVQQYVASGLLERSLGYELRPERMHVFVCGNPGMVGAPCGKLQEGARYTTPQGMCELLESRGFHCDRPELPGNVHYEQYGEG